MAFVKLESPERGVRLQRSPSTLNNVVLKYKIKFKKPKIWIQIGRSLADEFGIKFGDKVWLYYDDKVPQKWMVVKSTSGRGTSVQKLKGNEIIFYIEVNLMGFKDVDISQFEKFVVPQVVSHIIIGDQLHMTAV